MKYLKSLLIEKNKKIPLILQESIAFVVIRFNFEGNIIDCNQGFANLFNKTVKSIIDKDYSKCFINPTFSQFKALINNKKELVYEGILTLGNTNNDANNYQSIVGKVLQYDNEFWLLAEHDINNLKRLNDTIIELNEELSLSYRKMSKLNKNLIQARKEIEQRNIQMNEQMTKLKEKLLDTDKTRQKLIVEKSRMALQRADMIQRNSHLLIQINANENEQEILREQIKTYEILLNKHS